MIPDFRNCSASPEPGWTTTATGVGRLGDLGLGLADADVSITTTSKAAASACAAARVAGASPPSRSPAAVERMNSPRSAGRLDPRAVAEQRAARALGGRVDGQHGDGPPAARQAASARRAASTCRRPAAR
jgi:hypothetical protein